MKYVIYDLETLKSCITACFKDYQTGKKKEFVLFDDINQFFELVKFLKSLKTHGYHMVGFNNIRFDAPIIEEILRIEREENFYDKHFPFTIDDIIAAIYRKAQEIIASQDDRFGNSLPEWKLSIPQIDLFKQKHYDRPQRFTSLKWVQFSMRYPNIEEMPIHHDTIINKEDIPSILSYNWNDVDSTEAFFKKIMFETDLRIKLSEEYGMNLLNASEPKIARDVFGKFLSKEMGITYKELKDLKTHHSKVVVKDIIFPYIKFENPVFQQLLDTFSKLELKLEDKFEQDISAYGLKCKVALGGLHSINKPVKIIPKDGQCLITSDVVSFYPKLSIQNDLKPEHLGNTFIKTYSNLFDERRKYDKKNPMNYVLKILINSVYGLSSEPNSYLFDYKFTRAICINGQLSLLMLIEMIKYAIPDAEFVMANTDGIEVLISKADKDKYDEVCKQWETITKLELEHGEYQAMYVRDVNNYLSHDIKDNLKFKGAFEIDMDFHKNPSFRIIPKAIQEYFIKGVKCEDYVNNATDIYDFLGAVKRKSNFDLNVHLIKDGIYVKESQQKVCRYYISNKGGQLIKDFHDGRQVSVMADNPVQIANKIGDTDAINYDINRSWYIKEALKIINLIEASSLQLKLF